MKASETNVCFTLCAREKLPASISEVYFFFYNIYFVSLTTRLASSSVEGRQSEAFSVWHVDSEVDGEEGGGVGGGGDVTSLVWSSFFERALATAYRENEFFCGRAFKYQNSVIETAKSLVKSLLVKIEHCLSF